MRPPSFYVGSAFVPFRARRIDAIADVLVQKLRLQGYRAERLLFPLTGGGNDGNARAAMAASMVNLRSIDGFVALEFPATYALCEATRIWILQGGRVPDPPTEGESASLPDPARLSATEMFVEPPLSDLRWGSALSVPNGFVTEWLEGLGALDGAGTLVVSLSASSDDIARAHGAPDDSDVRFIPSRDLLADPQESPDDRIWRSLGSLAGAERNAIVLYASAADATAAGLSHSAVGGSVTLHLGDSARPEYVESSDAPTYGQEWTSVVERLAL